MAVVMNTFNMLTYILLANHSLSTIVTLIVILKCATELYTGIVWDLKYWNFFLNHSSFNAQFNYKHVVWIFIPPHTYIFVSHIPTNNK